MAGPHRDDPVAAIAAAVAGRALAEPRHATVAHRAGRHPLVAAPQRGAHHRRAQAQRQERLAAAAAGVHLPADRVGERPQVGVRRQLGGVAQHGDGAAQAVRRQRRAQVGAQVGEGDVAQRPALGGVEMPLHRQEQRRVEHAVEGDAPAAGALHQRRRRRRGELHRQDAAARRLHHRRLAQVARAPPVAQLVGDLAGHEAGQPQAAAQAPVGRREEVLDRRRQGVRRAGARPHRRCSHRRCAPRRCSPRRRGRRAAPAARPPGRRRTPRP